MSVNSLITETCGPAMAATFGFEAAKLAEELNQLCSLIKMRYPETIGQVIGTMPAPAEQQPRAPGPVLLEPGCSSDERLAHLQSIVTDLLAVIDDDARQMDASLDDAHRLVRAIRVLVEPSRPSGGVGHLRRQRAYRAFEHVCAAENYAYEVYSADLEHFRKRQQQNLGVASVDADVQVLARRRQAYISTLLDLHGQVAVISKVFRAWWRSAGRKG